MMEPVAWTSAAQLQRIKEQPSHNHRMWGEPLPYHDDIPLVRLSDAEARIAELEAKIEWLELEAEGHDNAKRDLAEVLNCADEPRWKYMRHEAVKLKARADAAEALLKEAGPAIEKAMAILRELEGKLPHALGMAVGDAIDQLRFPAGAARATHHKIGVKDE